MDPDVGGSILGSCRTGGDLVGKLRAKRKREVNGSVGGRSYQQREVVAIRSFDGLGIITELMVSWRGFRKLFLHKGF